MTASKRLREVAEAAALTLENATAEEVVRWAAETFGDRVCVTSSMTDAVVVHLVSRVHPGVDVLFVDTGYHFAETLGTREAVAVSYPVSVVDVRPERTVAEQDRDLGPQLHARDPDLCCRLRKVEPLNRALGPYTAWISGVRREETEHRRGVKVVEYDVRRAKVKINPIAAWTEADVARYIAEHGVLVNPLVSEGYPSIGCAPCTRRVNPGEGRRAGRWAGTNKIECGIHL